ncbi:hypothetical protein BKA60DRAFT_159513 [Fusarium oxysporum]|nr:hypothetical protein BKA60DRAFT_159513 [Fusarium oxysporum]
MADTTDFTDPESNVPFIIGITVGLTSLSTVLTCLRLYTRVAVLKTQGLDDAAVAVAQILAVGLAVATCLETHFGLGRHMGLLSQQELISQAKCLFAAIQTYIWALCIVKVAILLQYRRVFSVIWTRKVALGVIIFSVVWNILQSILCALTCIPVPLFVPSRQGHCLDSLTVWLVAAVFNISTDFIVFALPLPAVYLLHLPTRQKILLSGVFCLGFFTCVVSIVRARELHMVMSSPDSSWVGQGAAVWTVIEINCALTCACLPVLRPLISKLLPGLLTHHTSQPSSGERYGSRSTGSYALRPGKKMPSVRTGSTEALRSDPLHRSYYGNTLNTSISGGGEGSSVAEEEGDRHVKEYQNIQVVTEMVIKEETQPRLGSRGA